MSATELAPPPADRPSPPGSGLVAGYLETLLERFADLDGGEVASYIPELQRADPSLFGICLVTAEGAIYEAGDTQALFTMQSISKPLTYGIALELLGEGRVSAAVGLEPSGDAFNEISLARKTGRPANPLINAGAIACAGLVESQGGDPLARILETYSRYAGRALAIDEAVYRSEAATGHRNRAIAHLLASFGVIEDDPEGAVDLYFRQCSVSVTCRDLAAVGATLAGGGVNPHTGERAVSAASARKVLSVMATCGMYDAAGEWLVSVGLPAKSGVSGGVLAVLPGRLGIAVYSPKVDTRGNSVRGVAVCRALSDEIGLHLVRPGEQPPPPIRSVRPLSRRPSKRVRPQEHVELIRSAAGRALAVELQGELDFAAAEALARSVVEAGPAELVVVDLGRVLRLGPAGVALLAALGRRLEADGGSLYVACPREAPELAELGETARVHPDLDAALEACEEELLQRLEAPATAERVSIAEHELLAGLEPGELEGLGGLLGTVAASPGEVLARAGEEADRIFLVVEGALSVYGPRGRRLATLAPGMTFGELPYLQGTPRTADVRADGWVTCATLPYETLHSIQLDDPVLYGKLIRNLLALAVRRLLAANADAEMLSG